MSEHDDICSMAQVLVRSRHGNYPTQFQIDVAIEDISTLISMTYDDQLKARKELYQRYNQSVFII